MTTITEEIDLPGAVDPGTVTVRLQLWGVDAAVTGYETTTGKTIAGIHHADGNPWSITNVVGNTDIDAPAGTVYQLLRWWPGLRAPLVDYLDVPATGGPYRLDQILTDPPAALTPSALSAHIADTTLHAGRQLALAEIATNFTTTSTTFVDIPGASITLTIPNQPFFLDAAVPLLLEESGATAELELVHTGSVRMSDHVIRATAASHTDLGRVSCPVPVSFHAPSAATEVTYKLRLKTSVATSDVTAFVDFLGIKSVGYLRAVAA